jgi:pyridoxamine 5'-phosphate oxidase
MATLRDRLRALPSIVGSPPSSLEHPAPSRPDTFFMEWLTDAIDAEISEPHAITLCTVDSAGRPDARVLIIKDVSRDGIEIGISGHSPKAMQMARSPHVALSWYASPHARAVRIRGVARRADSTVEKADWEARGLSAKAIALAGKQSTPFEGDRVPLIKAKEEELAGGSVQVSMDWQVWRISLDEVEFWQGAKSRNHDRVKYTKVGDYTWDCVPLWP